MDGEIPSFTGEKVNQHMANINIKIKISVKYATRHTILEKLNLSGARLYDLSGLSGKKMLWEKNVSSEHIEIHVRCMH